MKTRAADHKGRTEGKGVAAGRANRVPCFLQAPESDSGS